jgi:hypothetical protein
MVRWVYPAEREWRACERCHAVIEADDRKTLLERVMLQPIPRTLDDRHADRLRDRARELHERFWETRSGPARPA